MKLKHGNRPINIQIMDGEYTPTSLITFLNESLTGGGNEASIIKLKGICIDLDYEEHKGFYFGKLEDEEYDFCITLKIPVRFFDRFLIGSMYLLKGIVEKQIHYSSEAAIKFVFHVKEIIDASDDTYINDRINLMENIIKRKTSRFPVEENLLNLLKAKSKPKILIITGNESVALDDILRSIDNAKYSYQLDECKVSLRDPQAISEIIDKSTSKYDLIAIARGGGSGADLNLLSDPQILESALKIKGFVTAIGHFADNTPLDIIADAAYGTPTHFGNQLREISKKAIKRKSKGTSTAEFIILLLLICLIIKWFLGL